MTKRKSVTAAVGGLGLAAAVPCALCFGLVGVVAGLGVAAAAWAGGLVAGVAALAAVIVLLLRGRRRRACRVPEDRSGEKA